VLEEEGALLGFYTLLESPEGTLELEHLFVEPDRLRGGLGGQLLRHALRRAAERGFAEVCVLSDPNAAGFYRAHGARREEEIPSSIPGRSLSRLILPLAAAGAIVRPERSEDHAAVFRVLEGAFGRPGEAELVAAIRPLRPNVSLVAEWEGEVVGHVYFSPVTVRSEDGDSWPALALGPMAVAPERQQLGLGGLLVRRGLAACRALGETRVFVLGHPDYYPRFGFEPAAPHGLHYRSEAFDAAFFVIALAPDGLAGLAGKVEYASAFESV
jgi:putative acetyltransferase